MMFQVIFMWNLSQPDEEIAESIQKVKYRGYNPERTYLTPQFANKLVKGDISGLSVSDIVDKYCPARRDLYYRKGINKKYRRRAGNTWGQTAGRFSQSYLASLFFEHSKKRNSRNYAVIAKKINKFSIRFREKNKKELQKLNKLASKEYENPDRLLQILKTNGRMEIGVKLVHTILYPNGSYMDSNDLSLEFEGKQVKFYPNPIEIGISKPSTPDFIIEKFKVVGDIKTGVFFNERYPLTCAGYALAYENWKKKDINWGMIYFLPTRIPIAYAKVITYAQIYIFPIDDDLRAWFLNERDRAYEIVSKNNPPDFPGDKESCKNCKYNRVCKKMGLNI